MVAAEMDAPPPATSFPASSTQQMDPEVPAPSTAPVGSRSVVTWPLMKYKKKQWINLVLLSLFTVSTGISAGMACLSIAGRGVLQSAVLLPVAVTILIIYTFWAASGGSDFKFIMPFAFTSLGVAVAYVFEQAVAPIGPVKTTAFGAGATVIFTAFIIFGTKRIVKTHTCDQFVIGAITLYVDMMSLFMAQPTVK